MPTSVRIPYALNDLPARLRLGMQSRSGKVGVALAGLVVTGAVLAAVVYVVSLRCEIATLSQTLADKTMAVAETSKRLDEQSAAMVEAKKRADAASAAAAIAIADLKLSVEAFARQAASCEVVKRQLNMTEAP